MDQPGQIAFQVGSQGKEIGKDDDFSDAADGQTLDRAGKVGLAEFQKGRLHMRVGAGAGELGGDGPNGLVGRFHPRPVTENDETGGHCPAPWM